MRLTDRERQDASDYTTDLWRVNWKAQGYPYCGIYVISPDNRWPCKIGISQNPAKRLVGLQTACWRRLDIAEYRYAPDFVSARLVEQKVHETLIQDGKLMNGEWFDIRPNKAVEVIDFAAMQLGVELRSEISDRVITKARISQNMKDMRRAKWGDILSEPGLT